MRKSRHGGTKHRWNPGVKHGITKKKNSFLVNQELDNTGGRDSVSRMRMQHPLKIIRKFLKGHPHLPDAWTQQGFARLAGCSLGLIRSVEQGATITPKLAVKIGDATGVLIPWLSKPQDADAPIPAAIGGTLTHEIVTATMRESIERYQRIVEHTRLATERISAASSATGTMPSNPIAHRMAAAMTKVIKEALLETLLRGDTSLMDSLTNTLLSYSPAYDPGSIVAAMSATPGTHAQGNQDSGREPEPNKEGCAGKMQNEGTSGWHSGMDQEDVELMA